MTRRTKQTQGDSGKEKAARRKPAEASQEAVAAKRRGRPKKSAEPITEAKKPVRKSEKPDNKEILLAETEPILEEPKKIVLKHFTAEEIELENKRKKVMWVSVAFVAILVLFVWAANLKRIVGADAASGGSLISFEEFKNNFSDNFKRINSSIADLKKEVASSTDEKAQAATTSEDYDTNIDEINKELQELITNASSTLASTTINNN
jgi:hypothetical protein